MFRSDMGAPSSFVFNMGGSFPVDKTAGTCSWPPTLSGCEKKRGTVPPAPRAITASRWTTVPSSSFLYLLYLTTLHQPKTYSAERWNECRIINWTAAMACSEWYGGITLCVVCLIKSTTNLLTGSRFELNPLNTKLNSICHLLVLLGAHHILHVSRIRVSLPNIQLNI